VSTQEDAAAEIAGTYLPTGTWEESETEDLLEKVRDAEAAAMARVALAHMPAFVLSDASDDAVERLEVIYIYIHI